MENFDGYERAILRSLTMRANPDELCVFLDSIFKYGNQKGKFIFVLEEKEEIKEDRQPNEVGC